MAEPQKTKGVDKDDGNTPKKLTPEEMARLAEEKPMSGLIPAMFKQDRLDGLEEDHPLYEKAEGRQSAQVTEDHNNADPAYGQQIFDAVEKGAAGKLDKLFSRGVGSPDCRDNKGRTPLIATCEVGNAASAGVVIRHGGDINAVDADGENSLMKAAYRGDLDMVELLVSKQAALDMRNNEGLSALEIAQEMGHEDVVAFLSAQTAGSTGRMEADTSTDPDDNGPTTDGPASASLPVPAVMMPSPAPPACVQDLDLEPNPELGKPPDFEPQKEPETTEEYQEEEPVGTTPDSESHSKPGEQSVEIRTRTGDGHDSGKKRDTRLAVPEHILAANEERIVYDAWDNKQIRSINEKAKDTVEKASLILGDHTVDTVFKGSYMAVLKPRSQEYKRFRKLWKHPDLLFDPRRWRDFTGASAVRKYCLAEGIDVSPLRATHFVELYYVKDLNLILSLAEDASAYNYTVRQLKRAIEEFREGKDDQDPGKVIIKTLDQAVPLLDDPDLAELCRDEDRVLEELSKAERKKIRSLIKARKPGLDEWKNLMDTLEGILTKLEDE